MRKIAYSRHPKQLEDKDTTSNLSGKLKPELGSEGIVTHGQASLRDYPNPQKTLTLMWTQKESMRRDRARRGGKFCDKAFTF